MRLRVNAHSISRRNVPSSKWSDIFPRFSHLVFDLKVNRACGRTLYSRTGYACVVVLGHIIAVDH